MRQLSVSDPRDRVGLSWRSELAAGIWQHLESIDVVEVIADDYFDVPLRRVRALSTLAAQVPLIVHGIGLGLASASPVSEPHLKCIARFVNRVEPESWSEHLAFVRAGAIELGHLAAPPRSEATLLGTLANLQRVRAVVGSLPAVENVASLLDPPGSEYDEASWVSEIVAASAAPLLLDLHNLYSNAQNFGFEPSAYLERLPIERVSIVHVAGGTWLETPAALGERRRLRLDDHLHAVPSVVFTLLEELAFRAPQRLTVILERDGKYPPITELLLELNLAREALARGRARRSEAERVCHAG
jgi:uncharacterized protein (UPF0276 family)